MSVWSSFKGSVSFRTGCGLSVQKAAIEWLDEAIVQTTQVKKDPSTTTVELAVTFCDDGILAAQRLQGFIFLLKSYDTHVRVDFQADIRFIS